LCCLVSHYDLSTNIEPKAKKTAPALSELKKLMQFQPLVFRSPVIRAPGTSQEDDDSGVSKLVEQAAEREALVSLMGSINTALLRQDLLVDALGNLDELLNATEEDLQDQAAQLDSHRLWLENGIQQTNATLEKMLQYLQIFYGRAYLPTE
jgi:hypothetical protein